MEFGKDEDNDLQYSDTREAEEEGEEEEEEEEESQDQFNNNNNNTNNQVIIRAPTRHHQVSLTSSLGPSSSSSGDKKWAPMIIPTATRSDFDQATASADGSGWAAAAAACGGEREHMFDKVVTPSDVGKLNRLVIPKQHAERYFPLDSSSTEKGLLLNFDDRTGKSWRFRYSYWNSSQSYVMTKGWSRFVKEKKLDAGDIVSFHRSSPSGRLFIDWRRRPHHFHHPSFPLDFHHRHYQHPHPHHLYRWGYSLPPSPVVPVPAAVPDPRQYPSFVRRDCVTAEGYYAGGRRAGVVLPADLVSPVLIDPAPAAAQPKRLRLFGVNMEVDDHDPQNIHPNDYHHQISPSYSSSSVQLYPHYHHHHHHQVRLPNNNNNNYNNNPSPILPLLPTTTTSSGSSFPAHEFSHKGKSSANSLSFDLDL